MLQADAARAVIGRAAVRALRVGSPQADQRVLHAGPLHDLQHRGFPFVEL